LEKITVGQVFLTNLIHEYDQKLDQVVGNFVSEELRPYFSQLFEFLAADDLGHSIEDPATMTPIISDFNEQVAVRIKAINSAVIQDFSDHRTAIFVVNVIFTQLLTAYQQFLEIHDQLIGKCAQPDDAPLPLSPSEVEQTLRHFHPTFAPARRK
jgi:hypothetical protein